MSTALREIRDYGEEKEGGEKRLEAFKIALEEVLSIIRQELKDLIKAEANAEVENVVHLHLSRFVDTLKTRRLEEWVLKSLIEDPLSSQQALMKNLLPKVENETFLFHEEIKMALREELVVINNEIEKNDKALKDLEAAKSLYTWLPDQRSTKEIERETSIRHASKILQAEKETFEVWLEDSSALYKKIITHAKAMPWTMEKRATMIRLVLERLEIDAEAEELD